MYSDIVSIRIKIVLVVLPILLVAIVLAGMSSYFVAARAVTRVATDFLDFKASELEKYAESQWNLLVENGVADRPDMVAAAKAGVESFAVSILRSPTELILGFGPDGSSVFRTSAAELTPDETARAAELHARGSRGFLPLSVGGADRVASGFPFGPFGWYVLVTEERAAFYGDVETITRATFGILAASMLAAAILLLIFVRYLTGPLTVVAGAMRRIIDSGDMSERVPVEYKDEIGQLSHTFNIMLEELAKAYENIKRYALSAKVAEIRERKTKNVFQLYVPKHVLDEVLGNPEQALVGDNRVLPILFSDIRGFTTISESMRPDDLVSSLNRYFDVMVDIIDARGGFVDKYIGDAIMAVFGAPVKHEDDALRAVQAGLEMVEALKVFNAEQVERGKPPFNTGIGINYGVVTVGNIGCDKKMNYTVIGDSVNLASRLEGQTKTYHQPILISESAWMKVRDTLPCRQIDKIAVKGKTIGVRVFTARKELSPEESRAWPLHETGFELYYGRKFEEAARTFREVTSILGSDDYASTFMTERCEVYSKSPPPESWDGTEVLHEK